MSAAPTAPSIGRKLVYRLSEQDCDRIQTTRRASIDKSLHGNPVTPGEEVPLEVVKVFPGPESSPYLVNGQAILDGNDSLWVCSAAAGHRPGEWSWPVIVPKGAVSEPPKAELGKAGRAELAKELVDAGAVSPTEGAAIIAGATEPTPSKPKAAKKAAKKAAGSKKKA